MGMVLGGGQGVLEVWGRIDAKEAGLINEFMNVRNKYPYLKYP